MPLRASTTLMLVLAAMLLALITAGFKGGLWGSAGCALHTPGWNALPPPPVPQGIHRPVLRVVTYNLHAGLGPRWGLWARREAVKNHLRGIAHYIQRSTPVGAPVDLVGLNEADFGSRRSGWLDQPAFLATELKRLTGQRYRVVYGTSWSRNLPGLEVNFGNAALARHPILAAESCIFGGQCLEVSGLELERPLGMDRWFGAEPRSALRLMVSVQGRPLDVLITHLEAFRSGRRAAQAAELTRRFLRFGNPTILLGDLNATDGIMNPRRGHGRYDPTLERLATAGLVDARIHAAARVGAGDLAPWATYPARHPNWPLDGVFATPDLVPLAVHVIGDGTVSDHRGLRVRYAWSDRRTNADLDAWHERLRKHRQAQTAACTHERHG